MTLIRICAWCGRFIGVKDGPANIHGHDITHGVCKRCADAINEEQHAKLVEGQSFK